MQAVRSNLLLSIFVAVSAISSVSLVTANRDAFMTTPEIVKQYRFPFETHTIVTEDGYILNHHRIPYGLKGPGDQSRPPVLLQHGLCGDSSGFVICHELNSIGFLLAEAGFDVWLLNTRGGTYSKGHKSYGIMSPHYWDFSYHEMAMHDLPETIDYVLNVTGASQVAHIGHSQGTTAAYVMLAEKPEYNKKIALHISYAPVAYHYHSKNPLYRLLSPFEKIGMLSMKPMRSFDFVPRNTLMTGLLIGACSNWNFLTRPICERIYYAMMGENPSELDKSQLATIFAHWPASSSMKQFTHFVQGVNQFTFAQFDYKSGNQARYGQRTPPLYNVSNVLVPIYTFYGDRDAFVQLEDVNRLHNELPNVKEKNFVSDWAHYDFLMGINAYDKIYKRTIEILTENLLQSP